MINRPKGILPLQPASELNHLCPFSNDVNDNADQLRENGRKGNLSTQFICKSNSYVEKKSTIIPVICIHFYKSFL